MRPNWENECVNKSVLIEWLRPYLHKGEPIPADVLISDIQMMPPTLTPQNEWVSVEERLPKQYKTVIVHFGNGKIEFDWADQQGHFLLESCYGRATHWMPLPEPPDRRPPVVKGDT